jgi:putative DNA primase/helicase
MTDYLETTKNWIRLPPHPGWFTMNALAAEFDPEARCPNWLKFLEELWGKDGDQQSIDTLQECFGYCLTRDTHIHKMMMIIGPPRSGKGTIAKVQGELISERGTAVIGLSRLVEGFEAQIIIGKQLVIIPDARVDRQTPVAKLTDILLSLIGGDNPSIPRKFKDAFEGKHHLHVLVLTNTLPRFPDDDSGAIASRFIIERTRHSFLGKEDTTLFEKKLLPELSGILNWSLVGLERIEDRGYFVQPATALDEIDALRNSDSNLAQFITDRCVIDRGGKLMEDKKALYDGYLRFCQDRKIKKLLSDPWFFQKLKDALPHLHDYRPTENDKNGRPRYIVGIRLKKAAVSNQMVGLSK